MKSLRLAALLAVALAIPSVALAQTWPQRSVRFVVAFPPGGSTDFIARIIAQRMSPSLGQTIVIDNRGGGGGNIGTDIVAKATPDGLLC